jgi:hypothetical protein
MIKIFQVGGRGSTKFAKMLKKYIYDNPNEIVAVARVKDPNGYYAYIALFKSKCLVGEYSALIQEWGTSNNDATNGGNGNRSLLKFLEEKNISVFDMDLENKDIKVLGYNSKVFDWEERKPKWAKYAEELMYRSFDYDITPI